MLENSNTLFQRIERIVSHFGFNSVNDFARNGLKYSSSEKINRIKKGGRPSFEILEDISNKFEDVDINWLITGRGDILKNNPKVLKETSTHVQHSNNPSIPLLPADAIAGMSDGSVSIREKDIQEFYTIPDFEDVDFMIRVKGSSMYPKYNSGDIIACRFLEGSRFIQWNKVYVLATQYQGVLVKRLKPSDNEDCFTAISDNEKYDPFDIPKSEITNIALVIGVIRLE